MLLEWGQLFYELHTSLRNMFFMRKMKDMWVFNPIEVQRIAPAVIWRKRRMRGAFWTHGYLTQSTLPLEAYKAMVSQMAEKVCCVLA
jgi:hypothetical protein